MTDADRRCFTPATVSRPLTLPTACMVLTVVILVIITMVITVVTCMVIAVIVLTAVLIIRTTALTATSPALATFVGRLAVVAVLGE